MMSLAYPDVARLLWSCRRGQLTELESVLRQIDAINYVGPSFDIIFTEIETPKSRMTACLRALVGRQNLISDFVNLYGL